MKCRVSSCRVLFLLLVIALTACDRAYALNLEKLLMPDELSNAHAELEEDCDSCHTTFKKSDQSRQCVSCHDHRSIADDLKERRGFHGRSPDVKDQPCKSCHSEHRGRDSDIADFDAVTFDHRYTDFELRGVHAELSCLTCHRPERQYRDAPGQCAECHREDDAHKGRLGKECHDCHGQQSWRDGTFDHDRTSFRLVGKHGETACGLCHVGEVYEDTSTQCRSCHQSQDVHRGANGEQCDRCHTPRAWDDTIFDHDRETRFRLVGAHRSLSCRNCHSTDLRRKKPARDCIGCHQSDDAHKGRRGRECGNCHDSTRWRTVEFDHARHTGFELLGAHSKLNCIECHTGNVYQQKLERECIGCHRNDDVHQGQEGESCDSCHNPVGWTSRVFFEHDLSKFPLIGIHAATSCDQCHLSATFKDTDSECFSCHATDDVHEQRLGEECAYCHNPNNWMLWLFDHNAQTTFKLDGKHASQACENCHRRPARTARSLKLLKTCVNCHMADDVHRGGFGGQCGRCHGTESFSGATVR